jgi:catechol 2,3-dioxygenase-like lactoylglutathione lyase family enzyme
VTFRLLHLTFDCADPGALADFWCAALGYRRTELGNDLGNQHVAEAIPPEGVSAPKLLFIMVPEPKTAKNRVHVDLAVPDRDAVVRRMLDLGATKVGEYDEWGTQWVTLRDPEGNEVCMASEPDRGQGQPVEDPAAAPA